MRPIHPWSKLPGLERETGRTSWHYQKTAEGMFVKLTRKQAEGFHEGTVALAPNEDGFVRIFTVTLSMKNRKPQQIFGEYCTKHRVGADGMIDGEHSDDAGETAINTVFGGIGVPGEEALVGAQQMAKRRMTELHRWTPSQADIQELVRILKARGVPSK